MNIEEAIKLMNFNLSEEANEESLKKQYRKMVLKYHPDKNKGDSTHFLKIKEAYEIILRYIKERRMQKYNTIIVDLNNNSYTVSTQSWSFNFG